MQSDINKFNLEKTCQEPKVVKIDNWMLEHF